MSSYYKENPDAHISHDWFEGQHTRSFHETPQAALPRGTVLKNNETGVKRVLQRLEMPNEVESVVCSKPHADEDFSYFCGNEHCRCSQ